MEWERQGGDSMLVHTVGYQRGQGCCCLNRLAPHFPGKTRSKRHSFQSSTLVRFLIPFKRITAPGWVEANLLALGSFLADSAGLTLFHTFPKEPLDISSVMFTVAGSLLYEHTQTDRTRGFLLPRQPLFHTAPLKLVPLVRVNSSRCWFR